MGKKSKKGDMTVPSEPEVEDCGRISKSKKKKRVHENTVEGIHSDLSPQKRKKHLNHTLKTDGNMATEPEQIVNVIQEIKKKKKKRQLLNDHGTKEEVATDMTSESETINALDVPKKKKKKYKDSNLPTQVENNQNITEVEEDITTKKKEKAKPTIINECEKYEERMGEDVIVKMKKKKIRSQKKKKSKSDVLNDEESQVTEEDIDRFCEELGDEDNKQFEDWVQLLEASLPPRRN